MTQEIHRHFLLYKFVSESKDARFLQIMVLKREQFEVRVFETAHIQLDPAWSDNETGVNIQSYPNIELAVSAAERRFLIGVKEGWRAFAGHYPVGR